MAYVCHDFEDAIAVGIVTVDELPVMVRERCGVRRREQLGTFINAMIRTVLSTGVVGMDAFHAEALTAFRAFNYESIYLRAASRHQASAVVDMMRALVEFYSVNPALIPDVAARKSEIGDPIEALHEAVAYVAGMTDRYACQSAITLLGWDVERLPSGIDR